MNIWRAEPIPRRRRWLRLLVLPMLLAATALPLGGASLASGGQGIQEALQKEQEEGPPRLLIALGDSLTQGTMDATVNSINTRHAYLERVAQSLGDVLPLKHTQPLWDEEGSRIAPFKVPTNLGVDGADTFNALGAGYDKRAGREGCYPSSALTADTLLPRNLTGKYDKVLYPINLLARQSVSQVDAATWLLKDGAPAVDIEEAIVVVWLGNNESSAAALGTGACSPSYLPIPPELAGPELEPGLRVGMRGLQLLGELSFRPYTQAAIEGNLTELDDFEEAYTEVVERLTGEGASTGTDVRLFLLTLPYYSSAGYLFDSEDLEFYLRKVDPDYTVPSTFKRVTDPGEEITDYYQGDRVSFLTFALMYALLDDGHSVEEVNRALEINGVQRDGLVLSEEEATFIRGRIDGFNDRIKDIAGGGSNVDVVDVAEVINQGLAGTDPVEVGDRTLTRKWGRGSAFSLDGVHPGYTGHAFIANRLIEHINGSLGIAAPLHDLQEILDSDPYVDRDGDGWVAGPDYEPRSLAEILFLFTDPDDTDPGVQPEMPDDLWERISEALIGEIPKPGAGTGARTR